ncbi:AIPR family protein [Azospirillum sp. TSH58]|uniref:AIPR family protein n=1 Tax=Azospirillum sp. TSH58 TaxID=664962 RepID=UPI001304FD39|nr:AIPR family protein [Azospirillum sp. TSH58]
MVAKELIGSVFAQRKKSYDPNITEDDAFEIFCADVILNNFDPSIEEIRDRIVDGGQDGGIDSVFIYVNRVLIAEDTDLSSFVHPVEVELIVIQSKNEKTFKEGPVDKIASSLPNLLRDFQKEKDSQGALNASVVSAFSLYDRVIKTLAPEFPTFKISIWYACQGDNVPPSARAKATTLENTIKSFMPNSVVKFTFAGANELYALAAKQKVVKSELVIKGSPLSGTNNSYIVLARITDYGSFISDEAKNLRSSFFDANVRDYEGSVDVNKDIAQTLREPIANIDFWWLNNGVTVLAQQASFMNGRMHIQNPLIVNGLQTSYELHRYISKNQSEDERLVMIRIIETTDEDVINKVIKATNYQTKVKAYSLRATEEIQRKIELYLSNYNIYYDRRRNYYKNKGMPAARTIGIDRLAQSVISILLERPEVARARPTSLMKDAEYNQIFPSGDDQFDLALYRLASEGIFAVSAHFSDSSYDRIYKNNLRFHVLMVLGWWLAGSQKPTPQQLSAVDIKKMARAPFGKITEWVIEKFEEKGAKDSVAKDGDFTAHLKGAWSSSGL